MQSRVRESSRAPLRCAESRIRREEMNRGCEVKARIRTESRRYRLNFQIANIPTSIAHEENRGRSRRFLSIFYYVMRNYVV